MWLFEQSEHAIKIYLKTYLLMQVLLNALN